MSKRLFIPGDVVAGQYHIKEVVGAGGFAHVYRAVEPRLGRDVALKVMSPVDEESFSNPEHVTARFIREARLVSQLTNPHSITLYDYDTLPDGRLYMALEFVEGITLEALMTAEGAQPEPRIRRIVFQLLDVLAEAHAAGILHRDIKPSNVMLFDSRGARDCVKLLDFGIAKKIATEEAHRDDITVSGTLIGTPRYMSPEQICQLPLSPASDLYSVGLLMYEMFAGRHPFPTRDVTEIYRRMHDFQARDGDLADAPEPFRSIVFRLLDPEPKRRFQSADEVLSAFGCTTADLSPADHGAFVRVRTIPPSFPVGFDRSSQAPSSELTGVDLATRQFTLDASRRVRGAFMSPALAVGGAAADPGSATAVTVAQRPANRDISTIDVPAGGGAPLDLRRWLPPLLLAFVAIGAVLAFLFLPLPDDPAEGPVEEVPEARVEPVTPAPEVETAVAEASRQTFTGVRVAAALAESVAQQRLAAPPKPTPPEEAEEAPAIEEPARPAPKRRAPKRRAPKSKPKKTETPPKEEKGVTLEPFE